MAKRSLLIILAVGVLAGATPSVATPAAPSSPTIQENLWAANGNVRSTVVAGNTLYVGGDFSYVGPVTGHGAAIGANTGAVDLGLPRVDGDVNAVAADGAGGWYVGGSFTSVGGATRSNLAHLRADGSVDGSWTPNPNGGVFGLALSGQRLYVGGVFTSIGGEARDRIAALDATTGQAAAWNPGASSDAGIYNLGVYALAVAGSTVHAGGNFTTVGGQTRNGVAAIDAASAQVTAWNPGYPKYTVVDDLVATATTVFVGAAAPQTDPLSLPNPFVAALDSSTAATNWQMNANGRVYSLALSGGTLFAGGTFGTIGGQPRLNLAALDAATGAVAAWNPAPRYAVSALAASASTLYVGGRFPDVAVAQPRNNLAAFSLASLLLTDWNPGTGDEVRGLAVAGETVYAGGTFTIAGGMTRNFLAALDLTTGRATSFNPNLNGSVTAMVLTGDTMFVAGGFNRFGGAPRQYLAQFTLATGNPTAFAPPGPDIPPYNVLAVSETTVYVGGRFTRFLTSPPTFRSNLAAFDRRTGAVTSWNPDANAEVYALALSGSTIYAGGEFLDVGGQTRHRIAALDARSGRATAWNPGAEFGSVNAIAVASAAVYAGGHFFEIGVDHGTMSPPSTPARDASLGGIQTRTISSGRSP
jgi:Domain of unknown function (DUF5122) beta-propeller